MKRFTASLLALGLALCTGCSAASSAPAASEAGSAAASAAVQSAAPVQATAAPEAVPADWKPEKPITMIVAYKEGSSTDVGARLLAAYASEYIGQPVNIKNIAANSGMTAWKTLADSAADGYTLGFINMPNIFSAIENGGEFTMQDFAPICSHVVETSVVVVAENSPYQTLEDLLEANRAASEAGTVLRAATNGVQASNDIGASLLSYCSGGWQFQHVAYGSTSDQMQSLLSGECDWSVAKVSDVIPLMATAESAEAEAAEAEAAAPAETEAPAETADPAGPAALVTGPGPVVLDPSAPAPAESAEPAASSEAERDTVTSEHVRVLAVFDTDRCAELPDVPTLEELGYPTGWYGSTRAVVAPAGTDPTIINYYAEAFRAVMESPDCIAAHTEEGLSLSYLDPTQLAERIDERERFNSSLLPKLFS